MRREWFTTGVIVVIVTAFAVWYLTTASGCDPASGVCVQMAPWAVPALLLIIGIGAGIMLFSLASTSASKTQKAAESLKPKVGSRNGKSEAREPEAGAAREAGEAAQAKNATEEKPLQDWTETLNELEAVLKATEEKFLSDQDDARARILNLAPKGNSPVEGEELIAREAAMEQSARRLQEPGQILTRRDSGTNTQEEEVRIRNERLLSIERWGQEAVRLSKELLRMEQDILASRESLLEVEMQLRSEFEGLTVEWNRFVANESSLLEAVQHLTAALGVGPVPPTAGGVMQLAGLSRPQPSPSPVDTPAEDTLPPSSSVPGTRKELIDGDLEQRGPPIGPVRVTKKEAVERMKKAARIAKEARDGGQATTEVHKVLKLALVSFKAGDFEDAVKHSEEVLEILSGPPSAP